MDRFLKLNKATEWAMKINRVRVMQGLLSRFNYKSYLEIGCFQNAVFNNVDAERKTGVDPHSGGTVRQTSDSFFEFLHREVKYDLIFIDGYHEAGQVLRDISNSLEHLSENGTIVVHDCLPTSEDIQLSPSAFTDKFGAVPPASSNWCGDVWKAIAHLKAKPLPDICVLDQDWGLGIIKKRANRSPAMLPSRHALCWKDFDLVRENMNVVTTLDEVLEFADQ